MEKYLTKKHEENFDAQYGYWHSRAMSNPAQALKDMDAELKVLYIRLDNDQEGRGRVGDTSIAAMIAGIEAVRAECLDLLKE
jgi:hypothetical protein